MDLSVSRINFVNLTCLFRLVDGVIHYISPTTLLLRASELRFHCRLSGCRLRRIVSC